MKRSIKTFLTVKLLLPQKLKMLKAVVFYKNTKVRKKPLETLVVAIINIGVTEGSRKFFKV